MVRVFRQYIPVPFLILGVIEIGLFLIAAYLGAQFPLPGLKESPLPHTDLSFIKSVSFALVMMLAMVAMGLYQPRFRYAWAGMVLRIVAACVGGSVALALLYYGLPALALQHGEMTSALLTGAVLILFARLVFFQTLDRELLKRRILVLGAGDNAALIPQHLRRRVDQQGFRIVGYVHVRGEHDVVDEDMVLRPDVTLLALAKELQADEIVVAVGERRRKSFPVHDLLDCKLSGIDVIDLQGFFERETGKIKLDILNPSWMIFSDGFNQVGAQPVIKRMFDIGASLLLLALAWPLMILIAVAILAGSGGKEPILYRQIRVGRHWRLFHVYKFRSMRVDAEKEGKAIWAQKDDPRVTRIGRWLRISRLDELPQVFNVLKGDMSFVGPRPERPEFVTHFSEKIPHYAERHRVKPGVTGWAQLHYPYGASERDAIAKLEYDLYYVKNGSFFLDLVILLQTAEIILWGRGAR